MMQDNQAADLEKCRRVGIDEQFIKFRPSPNLKDMKFGKFKTYNIDNANESQSDSPTSITMDSSMTLSIDPTENDPQPPLPPIQPESPIDINLTLKKEIDEQLTSEDTSDILSESGNLITEFKTDQVEESNGQDKTKSTMCKDFVRGTCTRAEVCKYKHEIDLDQLPGVYTFCHNFQNKKCILKKCKYVHATVFEVRNFYRTGILPPEVINRKKIVLPPPPPPPPLPEESATIPPDFTQPPPPISSNIPKVMPVITCVPSTSLEGRQNPTGNDQNQFSTVSISPRDLEANHMLAKKCNKCEQAEFSLQYNKRRVDKLIKVVEDNKAVLNQVNRKTEQLYAVLLMILKPMAKASGITFNNTGDDKEKVVMDRLNNFLSGYQRMILNEDSAHKFPIV